MWYYELTSTLNIVVCLSLVYVVEGMLTGIYLNTPLHSRHIPPVYDIKNKHYTVFKQNISIVALL